MAKLTFSSLLNRIAKKFNSNYYPKIRDNNLQLFFSKNQHGNIICDNTKNKNLKQSYFKNLNTLSKIIQKQNAENMRYANRFYCLLSEAQKDAFRELYNRNYRNTYKNTRLLNFIVALYLKDILCAELQKNACFRVETSVKEYDKYYRVMVIFVFDRNMMFMPPEIYKVFTYLKLIRINYTLYNPDGTENQFGTVYSAPTRYYTDSTTEKTVATILYFKKVDMTKYGDYFLYLWIMGLETYATLHHPAPPPPPPPPPPPK